MSNKLTQSEIVNNKERFIKLLSSVHRPGIDDLITWLEEKSDFFIAPSSTVYHGCYEGGLCQHSLNVYDALKKFIAVSKDIALSDKQVDNISEESLIIVSLLHDLCKTNFYVKEIKMWKDDSEPYGNQWKKYYGYKCVDNFPLGHGEKSVIMIQNFIRLSATEIISIRWHMGATDPGTFLSSYEKPAYSKAVNECPLLVLLQQADQFASFMMEHMVDPKVENLIE